MKGLAAKDCVKGLQAKERLDGLKPDEIVLALDDALLRGFSPEFLKTLSPRTRREITR
jgi:hypothetical protein